MAFLKGLWIAWQQYFPEWMVPALDYSRIKIVFTSFNVPELQGLAVNISRFSI